MSIAAIFPPLTVKAMIENGFPSSMQTSPACAVDERRAPEQAEAREALRSTSHLLRAADLDRCARAWRRRRSEGPPRGRGQRRASGSHRHARPRRRRRRRFVALPRRHREWLSAPGHGGVRGWPAGEPHPGCARRWARSPRTASRRRRAARTRRVRPARASRAPRAARGRPCWPAALRAPGLVPSTPSMIGSGT